MEEILQIIAVNWKKIIGIILGFMIGCFLVNYGLIKTLIIILSTVIGYLIGTYDKNLNIKDWIVKKLSKGEETE